MSDIRLSFGFPSHPKTKRLIRKVGKDGAWHFVCLMIWAAQNKPDGDLSGMSNEDIELAVDWLGDDGAFATAIVECGFLDGEQGSYTIHDWEEHNPWAAGHEMRSAKAKFNALKRHHGIDFATQKMPEYAATLPIKTENNASSNASSTIPAMLDDASSNASSKVVAMHVAQSSNAPTPSPSPSPTPTYKTKEDEASPPSDLAEEIFAIGKKLLGPKAGGLLGQARKRVGDQKVVEVLAGMSVMKPAVSEPLSYFVAATTPKVRGFVC